jgi:drug/metabolite transporter (DMT)-like permease
MGIALALSAAMSWGCSDFLAGLAARRGSVLAVAALAQFASLCTVAILAPLLPGHATPGDIMWGALAGLAAAGGLVALYRGLAIGPMSVIAPATAGSSAAIPVAFGVLTGERPTGLVLAGLILAFVAVVLLATSDGDGDVVVAEGRPRRVLRSAPLALIAGVGFGAFFILLDRTGDGVGLWPLVAARVASAPVLAYVVLLRRERLQRTIAPAAVGAGVLDAAASAASLIALGSEVLPIVAVISSLYPAATIALAGVVTKERIGGMRLVHCGLALLAITLIAAG